MSHESPAAPESTPKAPLRTVDQMARLLLAAMNEVAQSFPEEFASENRAELLKQRQLVKVKYTIDKQVIAELEEAKREKRTIERTKGEREPGKSVETYQYPGPLQEKLITGAAQAMRKGTDPRNRLPQVFIDALVEEAKKMIQNPLVSLD